MSAGNSLNQPLAALGFEDSKADQTVIPFLPFAHAESIRSCGTFVAAMRPMSPKPPFDTATRRYAQTVISLHVVGTTDLRTNQTCTDVAFADAENTMCQDFTTKLGTATRSLFLHLMLSKQRFRTKNPKRTQTAIFFLKLYLLELL